jgi:hypothetical protein
MKTAVHVILGLVVAAGLLVVERHPVVAQAPDEAPLVSLVVRDQALGNVLDYLSRVTGFRFNLDQQWQDVPVSANFNDLPLEQGLNRILRRLNHSLIWESEKVVTIMVFGRVEPAGAGDEISHAAPPNPVPEEPQVTEIPDSAPEAGDESSDESQSLGGDAVDDDAVSTSDASAAPAVPAPATAAE